MHDQYGYNDEPRQPHYLPSPQTIARETARIRQSWTEAEHRRRAGERRGRWTVPVARRPSNLR